MHAEISFIDLFLQASWLVKFVMLLLLGMSIYSWTIIFSRSRMLSVAKDSLVHFEERFWSGHDLSRLYKETSARSERIVGGEKIFYTGFKEYYMNNYCMNDTTKEASFVNCAFAFVKKTR